MHISKKAISDSTNIPCIGLLSQFIFDLDTHASLSKGRLAAVADALGVYCERAEWTDPDDPLSAAVTAFIDDLTIFCNLTGMPVQNLCKF